jgi:hypothetical protein
MAKLNIEDKSYLIPERLTIQQWCAAMSYDFEDPKFYPQIVAQVTGAPLPLLAKAPKKALILAISLIVSKLNERREKKELELDNLLFGEFVDMDVWLNLGVNLHLQDMVDLLGMKTKWADEAMWAIDQFSQYRMYIYRQYKLLFGIGDIQPDSNDHTDMQRLDLARSWYRVIVGLAGDNLLNIDKVTEEPLKKVLNFMALQKERALEEEQKRLEQKRKYDLQRRSR